NFAMEVADLASEISGIQVAAFAVNIPPYEPGGRLLEKPVYWLPDLAGQNDAYDCICAIGTTRRWQTIVQAEQMGFRFAKLIHPAAKVSRRAVVGEGSIVSVGAILATHVEVGRHVIVNRGVLVGHHSKIEDSSTIAPGANIAGNVVIGKRVWVGIGATILERLTIGEQAVIGAASLVTHDVTPHTKVMGVPARVIEKGIDGYS